MCLHILSGPIGLGIQAGPLRDPKPDPFQHVSRDSLWPLDGVESGFSRENVGLVRTLPCGLLEHLPENQ